MSTVEELLLKISGDSSGANEAITSIADLLQNAFEHPLQAVQNLTKALGDDLGATLGTTGEAVLNAAAAARLGSQAIGALNAGRNLSGLTMASTVTVTFNVNAIDASSVKNFVEGTEFRTAFLQTLARDGGGFGTKVRRALPRTT